MSITQTKNNPLKKIQSLIVIANKLIRVIYTRMKKGLKYNPEKMTNDIWHPEEMQLTA